MTVVATYPKVKDKSGRRWLVEYQANSGDFDRYHRTWLVARLDIWWELFWGYSYKATLIRQDGKDS